MAKFTLTIDIDSAAFDDGKYEAEIARIIYSIAARLNNRAVERMATKRWRASVERDDTPGAIFDINGSRVGCFGVED